MKKLLLILLCLSPFLLSARLSACPRTQAGYVEGVLSPEGYTILEVTYPCQWQAVPVLVASPTGQGSLVVMRYEANSLTGEVGSVAIMGEPGAGVKFGWMATLETP